MPALARRLIAPLAGRWRLRWRRRHLLPEYHAAPTGRPVLSARAATSPYLIEIGPAHHSTLARRDGFDTHNVDYLDRAGLVEKYQHVPQYDMDDIEEVDHVLAAGSTFSEAIDQSYDIVLASHVLEHSISLIDFVNDLARLVRPGGHIALVVPDHRFCFDRFRELSSISRITDAHGTSRSVHTPGTLDEFTLYATSHRGTNSRVPGHRGSYRLLHGTDQARRQSEQALGDTYIDVHNWIFSPNHLRLVLQDLAELGLIDVRESYFAPTVGPEFFLNLSPTGAGTGLTREQLLELVDAERRTLDRPNFEGEGAIAS